MSARYVPGEGDLLSCRYVFVGEAPGAKEDELGRPFVGRSGQFLKKTLTDLGVDLTLCYFTNAVKVRPENNRTPTHAEIESWIESLELEIGPLENCPVTIIALGKSAAWALSGVFARFEKAWHPSYALRFQKQRAWKKQIKEILERSDK